MKAVIYNGPYDVKVKDVPDAKIVRPTDVLVRITTTNICGSDLHMYEGCQQRVKSDPLTATTNGLILIHLVYSGLASAITPAFRFCFSR